jgi:hypothetical protein
VNADPASVLTLTSTGVQLGRLLPAMTLPKGYVMRWRDCRLSPGKYLMLVPKR